MPCHDPAAFQRAGGLQPPELQHPILTQHDDPWPDAMVAEAGLVEVCRCRDQLGHEALDFAEGEAAAPSALEVGQGDGAELIDEDKGAISDEGRGGNVQVGVPEAPRRSYLSEE